MSRIPAINPSEAQGEAAAFLSVIKEKFGATPNFFRTIAHAPEMAKAFAAFNGALASTSLSAAQREVIALQQAGFHGCPYCAAYHTLAAKKAGATAEQAAQWLKGTAESDKERALSNFSRALIESRGKVSDADIQAFRDAGFGDQQIVEVVAVVAANVFTNFVNLIARTEVDFPAVELPAR